MDFGEIGWLGSHCERALQRLIGAGEVIETLINVGERGIRLQVVVVQFAQALPSGFGRSIAFDQEKSATETGERSTLGASVRGASEGGVGSLNAVKR